jgi:hypothetical protein
LYAYLSEYLMLFPCILILGELISGVGFDFLGLSGTSFLCKRQLCFEGLVLIIPFHHCLPDLFFFPLYSSFLHPNL